MNELGTAVSIIGAIVIPLILGILVWVKIVITKIQTDADSHRARTDKVEAEQADIKARVKTLEAAQDLHFNRLERKIEDLTDSMNNFLQAYGFILKAVSRKIEDSIKHDLEI